MDFLFILDNPVAIRFFVIFGENLNLVNSKKNRNDQEPGLIFTEIIIEKNVSLKLMLSQEYAN